MNLEELRETFHNLYPKDGIDESTKNENDDILNFENDEDDANSTALSISSNKKKKKTKKSGKVEDKGALMFGQSGDGWGEGESGLIDSDDEERFETDI